MALRTFERFCRPIGIKIKKTKTDRRQGIIFLGIRGDFPSPANNMLLSITLPEEKARAWTAMIQRILATGYISHAELE